MTGTDISKLDRGLGPGASFDDGLATFGQDAGEIAGESAAGDVSHGPNDALHAVVTQYGANFFNVDFAGLKQLLAKGSSQSGNLAGEVPFAFGDDFADQRIAVGVQA